MSDKKMFISAIWITVIMLFVSGCGKQGEPVSAEPAATVKEADTEESLEPSPAPTVKRKGSMESSEAPDNSEDEVTAESIESTNTQSNNNTATNGNASNSNTTTNGNASNSNTTSNSNLPNSNTTNGNTANNNASNSNAPAQSIQPASTPEPTPEPTPAQPAHTHTWKEHVVATQTWVPNIVVVDDYEYQYVESYRFLCNECSYETTSRDAIAEHVYATYHGFTIQNNSYTQQVKVGSHEEDQGHYETSTYVDYYYCDCGATK